MNTKDVSWPAAAATGARHALAAARLIGAVALLAAAMTAAPAADLRVGMIGLDTSHVVAFTKLLNDHTEPNHIPGAVVTAAFRSGSPDMRASISRVPRFAAELADKYGVKLCDTIDEVLAQCDVVMIENVDGRKHLEIAQAVFPSGKPVFIDKPLAGTLAQGMEIARLAQQYQVPFFSASSLRYAEAVTKLAPEQRVSIRGAMTFSPCATELHHPDLFWYGVHGVEMLYSLLGAGCESLTRMHTDDGDVVTGRWADGRIGIFYGYREAQAGYGYKAILAQGVASEDFKADYVPLLREVIAFFQTRRSPVSTDEMIEVLAFMEAADESKRRGGGPVSLAEVMKARGGAAAASSSGL